MRKMSMSKIMKIVWDQKTWMVIIQIASQVVATKRMTRTGPTSWTATVSTKESSGRERESRETKLKLWTESLIGTQIGPKKHFWKCPEKQGWVKLKSTNGGGTRKERSMAQKLRLKWCLLLDSSLIKMATTTQNIIFNLKMKDKTPHNRIKLRPVKDRGGTINPTLTLLHSLIQICWINCLTS